MIEQPECFLSAKILLTKIAAAVDAEDGAASLPAAKSLTFGIAFCTNK
jgi:hypothetical protein